MEFMRGQVLLITQEGNLIDQARIQWVEETGNGRILQMVSTMRNENQKYWIGEVLDETWQILPCNSLEDAKLFHNSEQPVLTLEIVQ